MPRGCFGANRRSWLGPIDASFAPRVSELTLTGGMRRGTEDYDWLLDSPLARRLRTLNISKPFQSPRLSDWIAGVEPLPLRQLTLMFAFTTTLRRGRRGARWTLEITDNRYDQGGRPLWRALEGCPTARSARSSCALVPSGA